LVNAAGHREGEGEAGVEPLLGELRRLGLACAPGPANRAADYARAWRYSHHVELSGGGATLSWLEDGRRRTIEGTSPRDLAVAIVAFIAPNHLKNEG
jgi:hypothetical protein